jgi:DNA-binding NarL/FixJ family response regulator
MRTPASIFIVDDHALLRDGLKFLLAKEHEWNVVGESGDGVKALSEILRCQPDVVILDLKLPGMSGEDILRELRRAPQPPKVLVISQLDDIGQLRRVMKLEPEGILMKSGATGQVLSALAAVLRGERFVGPEVKPLLSAPEDPSVALITERERDVAKLLTEGKTNKEIAAALGCSDQTVKTHKANLMRKLGFANSAEVSAWAVKVGLV